MSIKLDIKIIKDTNGHDKALLLRGDWIFVQLIASPHIGIGEATHSGDDILCIERIKYYYSKHFEGKTLELTTILDFEKNYSSYKIDRTNGTAISALSQAAIDLIAKQNNIPAWKLFTDKPCKDKLPVYVTINRALKSRTFDDYRRVIDQVLSYGINQIKCAPFEKVKHNSDQKKQSYYGLSVLQMLSDEYPELQVRIDFHARFTCDNFLQILPQVNKFSPIWIEEPCEIGSVYRKIKQRSQSPVAAGELYFGIDPFHDIIHNKYADIIMPDIKHIGGVFTFSEVCRIAYKNNIEISPHNPSSPICAASSLTHAALFPNISSIEIPGDKYIDNKMKYRDYIQNGYMYLSDVPGIGIFSLE